MKYLYEYKLSEHWLTRKRDRIDNMEITYPPELFVQTDDKIAIKSLLDEKIRFGLRTRALAYEMLHDSDSTQFNVTIIARVQLRRNSKIFTPIIKTVADGKFYIGNVFVGISKGDTTITLLNVPESLSDYTALAKKTMEHMGNTSSENIVVKTLEKANMILDVDFLIKAKENAANAPKQITSPNDLDYKVKKDYIKSSPGRPNFITHKIYCRGEIKSSEPGMSGRFNKVVVQFPAPYGIKTFPTMYTDSYFLTKQV
jgi:hypothetical protein